MRPAADSPTFATAGRAPGIYQSHDPVVLPAMSIADTRAAGMVGLTQRGPMNVPVRVSSWDEFVEIYGATDRHYLTASAYGYFRNGGQALWVVRVAHVPPVDAPATTTGVEYAACAEHLQLDRWKKPTLIVRALDEGTWGNQIWFRCVHQVGAQALLTRDIDVGAGEAHVSTTRGFEVGALVKIYDREHADFAVLTEVGDKVLRWSSATPIGRKHKAAAPTQVEVVEFELHVALRDRREVFKGLQLSPTSRAYAPRVVAARSRLIRVVDLASTSPVPHNLPEALPLTRLAGGRDGVDAVTPEDFIGIDLGPGQRRGLLALAAEDEVTQLACPDAMGFCEREPGPGGELRAQRVQDQLVSVCELGKDKFAILDIPPSRDIDYVRRWRRRTDSSYAAYYWPWLRVTGPTGEVRQLPPSGLMAGVYATRDGEGVHCAPANVAIVDAEDVVLRLTEDHIGQLNGDAVNTFRLQRGVRPWGTRTAASDPAWRYINVRRLFIMLRRSIEAGFTWITFEPNDARTWESVRSRTVTFLTDLHQRGMLAGGNPEQAFFVRCDDQTNSPEDVEAGRLTCEIGVAPVQPAEFILISLTQQMGATSAG
ncbi:MAG: phage tail sheath C-terminal domain-containing protein [Kofleriaceae bacterium]